MSKTAEIMLCTVLIGDSSLGSPSVFLTRTTAYLRVDGDRYFSVWNLFPVGTLTVTKTETVHKLLL